MDGATTRRCALAGCGVIVEDIPGRPPRRYCCAAHRHAARQARRAALRPEEQARLAATLPWLREPEELPGAAVAVLDPPTTGDTPEPSGAGEFRSPEIPARRRPRLDPGRRPRRRAIALLGVAGILAGGYTVTASQPMGTTGEVPPAGQTSEAEWATHAEVTLASVDRQLDVITQTEADWNRAPQRLTQPGPPAAVRQLRDRKALLERRRVALQSQLSDYRSLGAARASLQDSQRGLDVVETALRDTPGTSQSPEQASAVATLEQQRDLRRTQRDARRAELAGLETNVAAAAGAPLPDDGDQTAVVRDEVLDAIAGRPPTPTPPPSPTPPRPEVVNGREQPTREKQETPTSGPPDPRGPRDESGGRPDPKPTPSPGSLGSLGQTLNDLDEALDEVRSRVAHPSPRTTPERTSPAAPRRAPQKLDPKTKDQRRTAPATTAPATTTPATRAPATTAPATTAPATTAPATTTPPTATTTPARPRPDRVPPPKDHTDGARPTASSPPPSSPPASASAKPQVNRTPRNDDRQARPTPTRPSPTAAEAPREGPPSARPAAVSPTTSPRRPETGVAPNDATPPSSGRPHHAQPASGRPAVGPRTSGQDDDAAPPSPVAVAQQPAENPSGETVTPVAPDGTRPPASATTPPARPSPDADGPGPTGSTPTRAAPTPSSAVGPSNQVRTDPVGRRPLPTAPGTRPATVVPSSEARPTAAPGNAPPTGGTRPGPTPPRATAPPSSAAGRPDPVRPDPVRTDPVRTDPVRTDPVRTDPVGQRPLPTAPVAPPATVVPGLEAQPTAPSSAAHPTAAPGGVPPTTRNRPVPTTSPGSEPAVDGPPSEDAGPRTETPIDTPVEHQTAVVIIAVVDVAVAQDVRPERAEPADRPTAVARAEPADPAATPARAAPRAPAERVAATEAPASVRVTPASTPGQRTDDGVGRSVSSTTRSQAGGLTPYGGGSPSAPSARADEPAVAGPSNSATPRSAAHPSNSATPRPAAHPSTTERTGRPATSTGSTGARAPVGGPTPYGGGTAPTSTDE